MILTAIVLVAALVLLMLDIAGTDVVFGAALIVLLFGGIISPEEALAGFSNKGMVTVGLLFIVSQAVENTGAFQLLSGIFLPRPKNKSSKKSIINVSLFRMLLPVSFLSAFLNNTPIVTIFTPVIKRWAAVSKLSPSKFLIPLSYATILGGTCTLIGTSTNLVVHGMMLESGNGGFSFFELTKVGLPVALVGLLYLILFAPRLLPDRADTFTNMDHSPKEYFIEMLVPESSTLLGKTIEQAGLRNLQGVYLTDIERGGVHLGPLSPDRRLAVADRLFFAGRTDSVADVVTLSGLVPVDLETLQRDTRRLSTHLVEVVVAEACPAVGHTIKEYSFRSVYDAVVVAISRNGHRVDSRLGDVIIRPGDTMVLLTKSGFAKRYRSSRDFYLVSHLDKIQVASAKKGIFALVVVLAMIFTAALAENLTMFGQIRFDMFYAAGAAVFMLILGRTITVAQARGSIRWDVLVAIGAAFGISKAIANSGLAALVGHGLVEVFAPLGAFGALSAVYMVTVLFTAVITNNASAALMFPIALSTASQLGVKSMPFFIAVAMGASNSFATPVSYQTNMIVQGAGAYRFIDFVRTGIPLAIISGIVALITIKFWYPF